MHILKALGFETSAYQSHHPDCKGAIFVLIRTPLERLKEFAEENNFKMKLDPIRIKNHCVTSSGVRGGTSHGAHCSDI